jgi:hypothetical protein
MIKCVSRCGVNKVRNIELDVDVIDVMINYFIGNIRQFALQLKNM